MPSPTTSPEVKLAYPVAEETRQREPVTMYAKQFLDPLPDTEITKLENILSKDPYLHDGRGQTGDTVIMATKEQAQALVNKYAGGILHDGSKQGALSHEAKVAFAALAAWYQEYRASFPDPSETEPLANHLEYLKLTRDKEMNWGICVFTDHEGRVRSAFSGQVLEVHTKAGDLKFGWGEHIFAAKDMRGQGNGAKALRGFEEQMNSTFGKTALTTIEVDNPFGILDKNVPENAKYFDHANISTQRQAWTDPEGMNMAMNPFERMKVWHNLGFQLLAVDRKDLGATVAFPYNQVPLAEGADPCETIFLAVRVSDPEIQKHIQSGKLNAEDFNKMYAAMQETVTEDFAKNASYAAAQAELLQHVGLNAKVKLVPFVSGEQLNPEALDLMERTANCKYTEKRHASMQSRFAEAKMPPRPASLG